MKNTIYHTCKPVRHTQGYIKGVIIFITEAFQDPHKIRIFLRCPKLKKTIKSLYDKDDRYLCMQKEDCMLCEGMTLPPLDCKILHMLLELSKHTHAHTPVRDLGMRRRQEQGFMGSSYSHSCSACVLPYSLKKTIFAIPILEKTPEITLPLSWELWTGLDNFPRAAPCRDGLWEHSNTQGSPRQPCPCDSRAGAAELGWKVLFMMGSLCRRDSPATWECWCDGDREKERRNWHDQLATAAKMSCRSVVQGWVALRKVLISSAMPST